MKNPHAIYQLKVVLLDTKPPIWRRLLVPADLTLAHLHDILQRSMEWESYHMHEFCIGNDTYGLPLPAAQELGMPPTMDERAVRLDSVLTRVGAKAVYTYDFGDGWEHGIVLEKILPPEPGQTYPRCIAGKRHAPPEDCGGITGFGEFVEAMRDPEHERHEELQDWYGNDFDPEAFSIDEVNRRLAHLRRRKK